MRQRCSRGQIRLTTHERLRVLGPRGTGKSTWARSIFPEALRPGLLDPAAYASPPALLA
jgi:hypothetical protein